MLPRSNLLHLICSQRLPTQKWWPITSIKSSGCWAPSIKHVTCHHSTLTGLVLFRKATIPVNGGSLPTYVDYHLASDQLRRFSMLLLMHWTGILHQSGIPSVYHYLDDLVIIGPPASSQCDRSLAILDNVCSSLSIPMAAHKREGLSTCLIILGIEIDTVSGQLRLSADKLDCLCLLQRQESLLPQGA